MAIAHPPYEAKSSTNWELEITQLVNLNNDKLTTDSVKLAKIINAIKNASDFAELQELVNKL